MRERYLASERHGLAVKEAALLQRLLGKFAEGDIDPDIKLTEVLRLVQPVLSRGGSGGGRPVRKVGRGQRMVVEWWDEGGEGSEV